MSEVLGAGSTGRGIVHLGAGAFARGLPWWATAVAVDAEPGPWSVLAVAHRSREVVTALAAREWRYDVRFLGPDEEGSDRVGIVAGGLVAADDPDAVVAAIAEPGVGVVTVTATEAAYVAGRTGPLDVAHQLAAAAAARLAAGAPPLSVVSCDNVDGGSRVLRGLAVDVALREGRDDVAAELAERWAWPVAVVDRVVPRVAPAAQPDVVADSWWRWVLEDDFAGPRPAWERAGVRLVADPDPWQRAKLLLVNAPHSLLALLGLARGHQDVAAAMGDPVVAGAVEALLAELLPDVPGSDGLDPGREAERTVRRFAGQRVRHPLAQVAAEGSTKLPQRLGPSLARLRQSGGDATWSTLTVALWVRALDRNEVADRDADAVRATASRRPGDRAALVLDRLGTDADDPDPVRDRLAGWLDRLDDRALHRTLSDHLAHREEPPWT